MILGRDSPRNDHLCAFFLVFSSSTLDFYHITVPSEQKHAGVNFPLLNTAFRSAVVQVVLDSTCRRCIQHFRGWMVQREPQDRWVEEKSEQIVNLLSSQSGGNNRVNV